MLRPTGEVCPQPRCRALDSGILVLRNLESKISRMPEGPRPNVVRASETGRLDDLMFWIARSISSCTSGPVDNLDLLMIVNRWSDSDHEVEGNVISIVKTIKPHWNRRWD